MSANQAFRYDSATSSLKSLGTLGGNIVTGDSSGAGFGINAGGSIAGSSRTSTNAQHAFLYNGVNDATTGLQLHDLGTLVPGATAPNGTTPPSATSGAYGINTQGDVVGGSNFASPASNLLQNFHAFLYKSGSAFFNPATGASSLIDLSSNSVVTNLATSNFLSLNYAFGINDNGWIIGQGVQALSGNAVTSSHAFLLKPNPPSVPEPSSMLALGLGVLGAGFTVRRRRK